MKATSILLASLLFSTACGTIVDPTAPDPTDTDDSGETGLGKVDGIDRSAGDGGGSGSAMPPPPPMLPFLTEAPAAAHTPDALFRVAFSTTGIRDVVLSTTPEARYDVLEQRIVTTTAEPITVTISAAAPTGTFARTLATDVVVNGDRAIGPIVHCADATIYFGLPECDTAPRPRGTTPASGAITTARWQVSLVSEATGAKVAGCIANSPLSITCALPVGVGAAYRVRVSADGFADLWNGFPGLAELTLADARYTGVLQDFEFQCDPSLYEAVGVNEYCYAHWVFNRYTAIDTAALAFQPMTVTIAAAGATAQFTGPALTWDAGDADLPGANY